MIDKLDGLSMDIEAENKNKLKSVFPECFIEGRLDIDKLLISQTILRNTSLSGKARAIACG